MGAARRADGRICGPCHLCCRVFPIPEIGKDHTDWCAHLGFDEGCRIYERRSQTCRAFHCLWMRDESLSDEWRPDVAGFTLSDPPPWALLVTCDPERPAAWRRAPYYDAIRRRAREAGARASFIGVREGGRLTLIFDDREVVLEDEGRLPEDGAR